MWRWVLRGSHRSNSRLARASGATSICSAPAPVEPSAPTTHQEVCRGYWATPSRSHPQSRSDRRPISSCPTTKCLLPRGVSSLAVPDGQPLFDSRVLSSIVKVYTVHSSPNFYMPWQMKPQRESTGSGFVIQPRSILTNAHVVADGSFVMVKRHGSSARYAARVAHVGHECDLALLEVDDPEFWEHPDPMEPLALGSVPELQDSVVVAGYPQGGHNLSVSTGVVSRVDLAQYVHGAARLMAIQIDAAINPGNSGGPALRGREVVGVAFQNLRDAEGIGYIIPTPVVRHFLADVEAHGGYVGFCSLGVRCQPAENPMLRASLGIPSSWASGGVLISSVRPLGAGAAAGVQKGDVLLEIDGVAVAADGTVPMRGRERISFDHLVGIKQAGESAEVAVLRDGEELRICVRPGPLPPLVPVQMYDQQPSYLVFAGLVFVPLTQPYLHEHGDDWYNTCPRALCERALSGHPEWPGQEVVVLSQVLVDAINQGYQTLADLQVHSLNGTPVASLRHLKHLISTALAACPDSGVPISSPAYLRFELDEDRVLVVDPEQIPMSSQRILRQHRIPAAESPDLEPPPTQEELNLWADAVALRLAATGAPSVGVS